ncbi:MAG TPA: dihydrodipicolinate synthase family protein, partial [Pararobbsia sp.]|nr:dihydrodipicolinate synthase family protein [Pararobbsia sp.]
MTTSVFKGIIAYPITPFLANDAGIDVAALRASIDQLIADGVHAIAPLGSTGESAYLSDAEWDEAAEAAVKHVDKRVPVVVGISDLTTRNAIRRARFAAKSGADAVMVLPISYWKLTEEEIVRHYAAIAEAISVPIMVYNNPATSGIDMSPQLIARLVREIDNVTMVKESTGDIQRMHTLYQLSGGEIPFYNGSNPLALEAFSAGATGWCTAAPNLIPKLTIDLYEATRRGDLPTARELFYRQLPVLEFILKGGLPTTIKAGLRLKGFDA